jgi:hypothetical protein
MVVVVEKEEEKVKVQLKQANCALCNTRKLRKTKLIRGTRDSSEQQTPANAILPSRSPLTKDEIPALSKC